MKKKKCTGAWKEVKQQTRHFPRKRNLETEKKVSRWLLGQGSRSESTTLGHLDLTDIGCISILISE